jgi:hypothetical protein
MVEKAADIGTTVPTHPQELPRLKSVHYVGNWLSLYDTVVALVYDDVLGSKRTFVLRSGRSVSATFGVTEYTLVKGWAAGIQFPMYILPTQVPTLPLFWRTFYDFVQTRTGNHSATLVVMDDVDDILESAIAKADAAANAMGDPDVALQYPVLPEVQLQVATKWFDDQQWRDNLPYDDLLSILDFIRRLHEGLGVVLPYEFDELNFKKKVTVDLPAGQSLTFTFEVAGVVEVELPSSPSALFQWETAQRGVFLSLHFPRITATDESTIRVRTEGASWLTHDLGKDVGDLHFVDVTVNINVEGHFTKPARLPFAPYHQFRQAFFAEERGENRVRASVDVSEVFFQLRVTILTAMAQYLLSMEFEGENLRDILERSALEAIREQGDILSVGAALQGLLVPILPNLDVCSLQDWFEPFAKEHAIAAYENLVIEGKDGAICISNPPPDEPEPFEPDHVTHYPTENLPGIVYDPLRPEETPGGGRTDRVGRSNRLEGLRLDPRYRAFYADRIGQRSDLTPLEEAAARLWNDGLTLPGITWLRATDIDRAAGTAAGRPVSAKSLASLETLIAGHPSTENPFLFAAAPGWPSLVAAYTVAIGPLGSAGGQTMDPGGSAEEEKPEPERPRPEPVMVCNYAAEPPLVTHKGSSLDPAWLGLAVNCVVVDQALDLLARSGALASSGTVSIGDERYRYKTSSSEDSPKIFSDLSGAPDRRPYASVRHLEVTLLGDGRRSRYEADVRVPLAVVKTDPGCLPDSVVTHVVTNRKCIETITAGTISDRQYLDHLLYRYFAFVEMISDEAYLTSKTLLSTEELSDGKEKPMPGPGSAGSDLPGATGTAQEALALATAVRAVLKAAFKVPVLFDPYHALNPAIASYEAKDGWLAFYETYESGL